MSSGAMFCLTSTVETQDTLTILGLSRDCNCTRIPEQVVHLQCGSVSLYTGVTLTDQTCHHHHPCGRVSPYTGVTLTVPGPSRD